MGTTPKRWVIAIEVKPCFSKTDLQIASIVWRARGS
jgi:hypothetical protein